VLGEQLMFSYTFTNRIDDRMRGAETEYAQMQQAWADRDWKIVRNFDGDEGARRFSTQQPGVKYLKSLAIRGVGKLLHYIDQVCAEAVQRVGDSMPATDADIAAYRQRIGK
jgi:hypothetical protein